MVAGARNGFRLHLALVVLVIVLAILSLMVGPAGLSPKAALSGLFNGEGAPGIIVRDIRLPRTLLALLIGATLGLSGAALQGLLRNPLAEPALFGAPQAAAAAAALVIAFGFAPVTSFAVPVAGILGAALSVAGLVALEIAFWLLGSLEDRSTDHLMIAAPFMLASWVVLWPQARAFRALTLGE